MKVAIVGANGQLGSDAAQAFADSGDIVFPLTHGDIEISAVDSVTVALRELKPDLIVNTAAMHHVERCERDPKRALEINTSGPHNLAMVSRELGAMRYSDNVGAALETGGAGWSARFDAIVAQIARQERRTYFNEAILRAALHH